MSSSHFPA